MVTVGLSPNGSWLTIYFEYNPELIDRVKMLPGRKWNKTLHAWLVPFSPEALADVQTTFSDIKDFVVDSRIFQKVNHQKAQHKEIIELKENPELVSLPGNIAFATPPFDHQRKALALCLKRRSFGLFMEMGTGKTKVIIDLLGHYFLTEKLLKQPALIVCPLAVVENWKREAEKHQSGLKFCALSGSTIQKLETIRGSYDRVHAFVINYESLWRIEPLLKDLSFSACVLDESTKIKHRATRQAKAVMRLGALSPFRYILTGTPMPNSPLELYNQIRFLDPTIFGNSWYAFRDRYAVMGGYQNHQVIAWKNIPELQKKLSGISFRVLKKDCLDLPEKIYKEYRLTMPDDQHKAYKDMAETLVASISGKEIAVHVVLAQLTKLRQLASGFAYHEEKALEFKTNPKLDQLQEIISLIKDHKMVIWTSFNHEVTLIERLLRKLKFEPTQWVTYTGSASQAERQIRIDRFQNEPSCQFFIGQQHAGGLGITLTAADYCVFFSNDYSPEIRLQAEDRLHRIGQKNQVTYFDLICRGTIESTICRMLEKKQQMADLITSASIEEIIHGTDGI